MSRVERRHGGKKKLSEKSSKQLKSSNAKNRSNSVNVNRKKVRPTENTNIKTKKKKRKKEKKPMKLINKVLLILVLVILVTVGGSLVHQLLSKDYISSFIPVVGQNKELFNDGEVNILIVGSDARDEEGVEGERSDTLILGHFDFKEGTAKLISIPRDLYVPIPGYGSTKINAAYAYGGLDLTKETIENLFEVEIDRTVQIGFDSFPAIVDTLGGVEIIMEEELYDDPWKLDLKVGSNILDGQTALRFVRFRGTPTADLGRMQRQQQFLMALGSAVKNSESIFEQTSVVTSLLGSLDTDININEVLYMFNSYKNIDNFTIDTWTALGYEDMIDEASVIVPDDDLAELANGFLNGDLVVDANHEEDVLPPLVSVEEKAIIDRENAEKEAKINSNNTSYY